MDLSIIIVIVIAYRILKILKNTQDKKTDKKPGSVNQMNKNQMKNTKSQKKVVPKSGYRNTYSHEYMTEQSKNAQKRKPSRQANASEYFHENIDKNNIVKEEAENKILDSVTEADLISEYDFSQLGSNILFPDILYAGLQYSDVPDQVPDYINSYLDF